MYESHTFSKSSRKPNKRKCETAGIGVANRIQVTFFGMKCVNLNNETAKIQILSVYEHIIKIESAFKILYMR